MASIYIWTGSPLWIEFRAGQVGYTVLPKYMSASIDSDVAGQKVKPADLGSHRTLAATLNPKFLPGNTKLLDECLAEES